MDRIWESVRNAVLREAAERVSDSVLGEDSAPLYHIGLGGATHLVTHGLLASTPVSLLTPDNLHRIISLLELVRFIIETAFYTVATIVAVVLRVLEVDWLGPVASTIELLDNLIALIIAVISWPISLITGRSDAGRALL